MPRASTIPLPGSFTQGLNEGSNAIGGLLNSLLQRARTREQMQNAYAQMMMAKQLMPYQMGKMQSYMNQELLNEKMAPINAASKLSEMQRVNFETNPQAQVDFAKKLSQLSKGQQPSGQIMMGPDGNIINPNSIEGLLPETGVQTTPQSSNNAALAGYLESKFGIPAYSPEQVAQQAKQKEFQQETGKLNADKSSAISDKVLASQDMYDKLERARLIIKNYPEVSQVFLGILPGKNAKLVTNQKISELSSILNGLITDQAKINSGGTGHITNLDIILGKIQKPSLGATQGWNLGNIRNLQNTLLNEFPRDLQMYQNLSNNKQFPFSLSNNFLKGLQNREDPIGIFTLKNGQKVKIKQSEARKMMEMGQ